MKEILNGIQYEFDWHNRTAKVIEKEKEPYEGDIIIPSQVEFDDDLYIVTSIGFSAFRNCSSLNSVRIPETVTTIEWCAFSCCSAISSIIIPSSVKCIGDNAFANCTALSNLIISSGVLVIGDYAFSGCESLCNVKIPDSIISIGDGAFKGGTIMESIEVDINNKVYDSRNNCNAIIETATNSLIAGCESTIIPNGIKYIGREAFSDYTELKSIDIPNSITHIGIGAFAGCNELLNLNIPSGVSHIEDYAFYLCFDFELVTIPTSVVHIGELVFRMCKSLKFITYSGTKQEWEQIEKHVTWNIESAIKVIHCADGDIEIVS